MRSCRRGIYAYTPALVTSLVTSLMGAVAVGRCATACLLRLSTCHALWPPETRAVPLDMGWIDMGWCLMRARQDSSRGRWMAVIEEGPGAEGTGRTRLP